MANNEKFTILYGRLSQEDDREGESNSIQNQRLILTRYAEEKGFGNIRFLFDDGFSGTNFNRPSWNEIMELIEDKQTIVLLNKADLDQVVKVSDLKEKGFEQIVQISAKEQTGIEELYQLIQDIFFEGHVSFNDEIYLTNMRHKTEVSEALKSLAMVLQSIEDGMPEDFFSIDLLDAYEHLGFITGESVGEDLVNEIFAEFCMGK